MLEKRSSLRNRFILLGLSVILVLGFSCRISVQAADVAIKQEVSASSGQPKGVIQLSVYVQGMTGSVEVAKIHGVLEYDTSLFTIQDVMGKGFTTDEVKPASGKFSMTAGQGKTVQNGDMLFTISLQINDKASVGKTTICVNEVVVLDTAGAENHIFNYIPSTINLKSASPAEDESEKNEGDGEADEKLDGVDSSKVLDTEKDNPKSSVAKKEKNDSLSYKKKASTDKKNDELDENYKTGAGFGNDIYLIVAVIMGGCGVAIYLIRQRLMKKNCKCL